MNLFLQFCLGLFLFLNFFIQLVSLLQQSTDILNSRTFTLSERVQQPLLICTQLSNLLPVDKDAHTRKNNNNN